MAGAWRAVYTKSVIEFLHAHVDGKRVANKIFECRELLETVPYLGRTYDPEYPAARTPFPCRVVAVPDTPFSLYYLVEAEAQRIVVFCIEYQRLDPQARFSDIDWDLIQW